MHYRQITYEVTLLISSESDHYKNSSVIVDLAMGQIRRSTERISSLTYFYHPFLSPCEGWIIPKAEEKQNEDFEMWCNRRGVLRSANKRADTKNTRS